MQKITDESFIQNLKDADCAPDIIELCVKCYKRDNASKQLEDCGGSHRRADHDRRNHRRVDRAYHECEPLRSYALYTGSTENLPAQDRWISSVNGTRPFCGASYTATKGAINTLTKNIAMRLCDTNIRCNAVAPGATVTPAHQANQKGEQPGGSKMLEYSKHYIYSPARSATPSIRHMPAYTLQ